MNKTPTTPWDPADHLKTHEEMTAFLEAALEGGDPKLIAVVLNDIARAKGMSRIACEAGLGREDRYKMLSPTENLDFGAILKVISALGFRLHAAPAEARTV
uniref:Probable addiction module antidote protein n=1 Tax=Candidatus Kentrum sp. FW TaxID=2126338 RepID=A0A450RTE5_9GAMM|nr:MAG: probable addiction module antidote protein [Candidatus Kentron sp. FW]